MSRTLLYSFISICFYISVLLSLNSNCISQVNDQTEILLKDNGILIDYDLSVKSKNHRFIPDSNLIYFNIVLQNLGTKIASGFNATFFIDKNFDAIWNNNEEIIWSKFYQDSLRPKDTLFNEIKWISNGLGYQQLLFSVDLKNDGKTSNNSAIFEIFKPYPAQSIVINEIMYNPLSNQSEYVEIYNNSENIIDLYKWKLTDQRLPSGNRNEHLILKHVLLNPKSYLTLSCDTNIFRLFTYLKENGFSSYSFGKSSLSLNNDMDDVIFFDFNETFVDSVRYFSSWHNSNVDNTGGVSLERININLNSNLKENWNSCTLKIGGTPGKPNSQSGITKINSMQIEISPNPFSPDGDGFEDYTTIRYKLSAKSSKIRIRIYDDHGRLVKTLKNNEYTTGSGDIIWNGLSDKNENLRIGMYIVLIEAIDDSNGSVETYKSIIVLARKL